MTILIHIQRIYCIKAEKLFRMKRLLMIPHKKGITFYKLRLSLSRVLHGTMYIPKLSIPFSYFANPSQKEDQFARPYSQGMSFGG